MNLDAKLSKNEMFVPEMICFCDIPLDDLTIHTAKYGTFGLSFSKGFIVKKGGAPVFYVPNDALFDNSTKAESFDKMLPEYFRLIHQLMTQKSPDTALSSDFRQLMELEHFLTFQIFGYLKAFDSRLEDDDPGNYYFEREWRVIENVQFTLEDVVRVLIPTSFARQFREDLPGYAGQITFLDRPNDS